MAEVTRVPLQPIAKGSLTKLWIGVAIAVLLAAGIAWAAMPKGVSVETLVAGEGPNPAEDQVVFAEYVGTLADGTEFDRSPASTDLPPQIASVVPDGIPMDLQNMVPGFREGMLQTQEGGTYRIEIPADMAYGDTPPPGSDIPPGSDLTFQVSVHRILSQEQFQQLAQQVQMLMMQMQAEMPGAGAPGAGAPPVEGAPR